ncbi:MAG TPA: protein kinase [Gemmatimonadaceae bacterium]|nr:protein kinase [Gemmatimonadaceae bacterium]
MESTDRLTEALGGRYQIERELGSGGMATVYLAHDVRHGRKVAVKVLHPELAAALGGERFLAEIKTTANLQHPHILPLHDSGNADGYLFYVMPFVDGESLRDRLSRERQLPIDDALRIARVVADALSYAHQRGVIHRDIKPENIMLQGGHALVADFGIALAVQQAGGARMTQTGLSLGTPQYMSPEQAMGEKTIDARTDVYALGVVTYEMLAGEPPFTGPTVQAIVGKVLTDRARPITELRRSVPAHVSAAIGAALEKLPADRIRSASEFAAALAGERNVAMPTIASSAARRRTTGQRAIITGLAALALASIAWGILQRRGADAAPHARARFTIPVTIGGLSHNIIAVSPDGSKIVFNARDPGSTHVYLALRRMENEEVVSLPATEEAVAPFFSPDGESVGFMKGNRLMRIDLGPGSAARVIAEGAGPTLINSAAWSSSGMIIFSGETRGVYVVPASGGQSRSLPKVDSALYGQLEWLPDNKRVLATRRARGAARLDVVVLSAETGEVEANLFRGLNLGYVRTGYLAYVAPDGELMAVRFNLKSLKVESAPTPVAAAGGASGSYFARALPISVATSGTIAMASTGFGDKEMLLVTTDGRQTLLPLGKRPFRGPRFSPDGKRIAVDVETGGDLIGDVWIYDRGPGTFARLTFEGSSVFPEWAPDGRSILYSALQDSAGRRVLLRVPSDRSAQPSLVVSDARSVLEGVEVPRTGTILFRENNDETGRDIYKLPPGGKPIPFAASQFEERNAAISPDGRFAAYSSNESGNDQIYIRPIDGDGGGRTQVSVNGGTEPRWAPGGRDVFYWTNDTLFAAPITLPSQGGSIDVGQRRLVLTESGYAHESVHSNYDIAPDGKTFVILRSGRTQEGGKLTVFMNWFDAPSGKPPR